MRRETAIRYGNEIAAILQSLGGIIGTPGCTREAFVIRRAWIFGSTAKGSPAPSDLDVLIEGEHAGRIYRYSQRQCRLDKDYQRRYGISRGIESRRTALQWLRGNRRMVRFHDVDVDGDIAHPRIMIYPRNDLMEVEE